MDYHFTNLVLFPIKSVQHNRGRHCNNHYFVTTGLGSEEIQKVLIKRFDLEPSEAKAEADRVLSLQGKGDTDDTFSDEKGGTGDTFKNEKGVSDDTISADEKGVIQVQKGVIQGQKGVIEGQKKVSSMTPEPSCNLLNQSSNEPSDNNPPVQEMQVSENLTIPENDFTTLHAVFLDESQKPAPSRPELKSWRAFYADIYHAAGCDVNMASEAIRVAIRIADGDNDQKKRYPINDPGSITKTATNWIAEYKRDKRREAEVNANITDLPPPEPEPERTPEEKIFDEFMQYARIYVQPAQTFSNMFGYATFEGKPNGKLRVGVPGHAKPWLDSPQWQRTIRRICDSIPSIEGIEFVAVS